MSSTIMRLTGFCANLPSVCAGMTGDLPKDVRHGLWIPAYAGMTYQMVTWGVVPPLGSCLRGNDRKVGPENERELILLDMGDILAMIRGRFGQGRHEGNSSPQLAQETRLEQPDQIQGMPTLSLCLGRSRSMTKLPPSWHLDISKKSCLLVKGTAFFCQTNRSQAFVKSLASLYPILASVLPRLAQKP